MKNQSKAITIVKRSAAGLVAAGLGIVMVAAPLSGHSAEAEVIPLAKGERMNQQLMAAATENAEFKLQDIDIKAQAKPAAPKAEPAKTGEAGSPAGGNSGGGAAAPAQQQAPSAPRAVASPGSAQAIAAGYVGDGAEFNCLVALWNRESHWNVYAANPSGAYGIPQALPGSKMASAGPNWQSDADTQIRWGLGYIKGRYGSPCAAWGHSNAVGWY